MYVFALFITIACLNIFLEKVHPAQIFEPALLLIFWQCATLHWCSGLHNTYMNFPSMCHPTLVFRPAQHLYELSVSVPPYTCVQACTTLIWTFRQCATLHLCSGLHNTYMNFLSVCHPTLVFRPAQHFMNFLSVCHRTLVFVPPLVSDSSEYQNKKTLGKICSKTNNRRPTSYWHLHCTHVHLLQQIKAHPEFFSTA